jgi:lysophospholipase L1-like esterase
MVSASDRLLGGRSAQETAWTWRTDYDPRRFEWDIQTFEAQDRMNPPAPGGIVFVGSSTFTHWTTVKRDLPQYPIINRGFGGSQLADSVYFADRIITKYKPKTVVVYAGDNDLASGAKPAQIARDFEELVERIHATLPDTKIAFVAVKPSPSRLALFDAQRRTNQLVRAIIDRDKEHLSYIDVVTPMMGLDGRPRRELFLNDQLHMAPKGYQVWSEVIGRHLAKLESTD